MDWQINAENYKRVYDYLLRKYADVDMRFFSDVSKRFVLVYNDLNIHAKATRFQQIQQIQVFRNYLSHDLISKVLELLKYVPENKKDELLEELKKNLDHEITSKACLNRVFQFQKRWVISAKTETIYKELENFCQEVYSRGVNWNLQVITRRNKPVYKISDESLNFMAVFKNQ